MAGTEDKKFESVQRLWDAYATILQRRGLDLHMAVVDGTERLRLSLSPPGARADFDELCEKGCAGSVLAFLVFFMRFSPKIRKLWSEMVVNRRSGRMQSAHFKKRGMPWTITLKIL